MPTTLLTGSNGYVGSTVFDQLLKEKHKVVAAVRTPSSGDKLLSAHPEWDKSLISLVTVPDFTLPGAFDNVFKTFPDIDYIIHVAAPLLDDPKNTDFVTHFEKPSVLGNTGLLLSAKQLGKNVKAVAVTGSINAITTGEQSDVKARAFGNDQWLPLGREDAIKAQNNYISYCVGKKLADESLWRFLETEKPSFTITNLMPPLIFGPMLQKVDSIDSINFSTSQIYSIMNSGKEGTVPNTMFPGYIDVRDLAALHILALTTPAAANKRFIVGHAMKFDEFADALRTMPELEGRVGKNNDEEIALPRFETKEAEEVFGSAAVKGRALAETGKDSARNLLEVEARSKA